MKRYEHYCSWDGGGPADPEEDANGDWVRYDDAQAELAALRKDALLGRFLRLHMTECHGGWAIAQTFIPGAPSLEDVTDALDPALIERALAR
jgi:hypothetical protein